MDMENIDPDALLKPITKPSMGSDIMISTIGHVLLIGLTSFGLFASWAKWGVHAPNQIKVLEKEAAKAEAAKAAEAAAAAKAEEAKAAAAAAPKAAKPEAKAPDAPKPPAETAQPKRPETPLDNQIEKPAKNFDLDELDL